MLDFSTKKMQINNRIERNAVYLIQYYFEMKNIFVSFCKYKNIDFFVLHSTSQCNLQYLIKGKQRTTKQRHHQSAMTKTQPTSTFTVQTHDVIRSP